MEAINKEILIEGVDPRELYGAQDVYLELMRELSPKVKVVARGSSLKALGAKRDVDAFERKMNALVEYYIKYGHISREVVEQAFSTGISDCVEPKADKDTIVFGNNGNVIRARTVLRRTQRRRRPDARRYRNRSRCRRCPCPADRIHGPA